MVGRIPRRLLLLALVLAACSPEKGSHGPSLAGYTLGASWQRVGRSLACRAAPAASASDSAWAAARALGGGLRWCEAADTVTLLFSGDTLVDVTVWVPKTRQRAEALWRDRLSASLAAVLGAPDSVDSNGTWVLTDGGGGAGLLAYHRFVVALWHRKADRPWAAEAFLCGHDSLPLSKTRGQPPSYGGHISLTASAGDHPAPCDR